MIQIKNLGRALSIIAQHEAREAALHADVDAFHAPGECHALVSRGEVRRERLARRRAAAVAGVRFNVLLAEARRRVGRNTLARAMSRAEGEAYARFLPTPPNRKFK